MVRQSIVTRISPLGLGDEFLPSKGARPDATAMQLFSKSTDKLDDARTSFDRLSGASGALELRSAFSSFVHNARAITYAMQSEGSQYPGFLSWYAQQQEFMKGDELIRFIHDARIDDFHKGESRLEFTTNVHLQQLDPGRILAANPQLVTSETWSFSMSGEGLYSLQGECTPSERKTMLNQTPLAGATMVAVVRPPRMHLGCSLETSDPVHLSNLALRYFEQLLFEAKQVCSPQHPRS